MYRVEKKPVERDVCVEHKCDLCGYDLLANRREDADVSMNEADYDGGSGTVTMFDVCKSCFVAKIIPWFASQGVQPRVYD